MTVRILIACQGTKADRPTVALETCRAFLPTRAGTPALAVLEAKRAGWSYRDGRDLCPSCTAAVGATAEPAPCPQAWHGGLPVGLLVECKYLERHRGQHRNAKGTLAWSGKLTAAELGLAAALRAPAEASA